jgi:hypothetical protein
MDASKWGGDICPTRIFGKIRIDIKNEIYKILIPEIKTIFKNVILLSLILESDE